jgi:hypothetical protein
MVLILWQLQCTTQLENFCRGGIRKRVKKGIGNKNRSPIPIYVDSQNFSYLFSSIYQSLFTVVIQFAYKEPLF